MKFYYSTILTEKFKPKTRSDLEKVKKLEKLLVRYLLVRILEEMSDSEAKKLEKSKFRSLADLAEYFKSEIPDFNRKFSQYTSEFLAKHVRNR